MSLRTANLIGKIAYRVAAPGYYQRALSAVGARQFPGRFNPVGMSVLYLSLDPTTAIREYYKSDRPRPIVVLPVRLKIKSLIDLRGSSAGWPTDWQQWDCDWKAAVTARAIDPTADCPSWRCGKDAIARDCSGIIFPSTQHPGGVNVAVFPEDAIFGKYVIEPLDPKGEIAAVHPPRTSD